MFLNQILEFEIVMPSFYKNLFIVMEKAVNKSHLRIMHIASITIICLKDKKHHSEFGKSKILISALLDEIIKERMSISDQALIHALRAISKGTKDNYLVCYQVLSY